MPSSAVALTTTESFTLLGLLGFSFSLLLSILLSSPSRDEPLLASLAFSLIAFSAVYAMIRWLGPVFMLAGLKGKDMSKVQSKEIPECMGAVCAVVYLLVIIMYIPFPFYKDIVAATSGGGNRDVVLDLGDVDVEDGRTLHRFPHSKLASYLSAILTLQSTTILGLADDLLDLRWRHKFFIPGLASIPLLIVYHTDFGVTSIIIPSFLSPYFGHLFNLGPLYYAYMFALSIFTPNSINILAGLNGLEVSQSIVIALLLLVNDAVYLHPYFTKGITTPATDPHLLSLYLLLPFLAVSLALWAYNRYPSRVFVGDTYCYFAGMLFASISILGHFSKTLLLLLIPQTLNFVYSVPQLFRFVPCPRHRLPAFNARSGLMEPSFAKHKTPPSPLVATALTVLESLHLIKLDRADTGSNNEKGGKRGKITRSSNMTIMNLWLVWWGPRREDRLVKELLAVQILLGLGGLFVRHFVAGWVWGDDNRSFGTGMGR